MACNKNNPQIDKDGKTLVVYFSCTPDDFRSVMLMYPALCIPDNAVEWFGTADNIPDTYNLWGVRLGRVYFERLFGFDVFDHISRYQGSVLLVHGDWEHTME